MTTAVKIFSNDGKVQIAASAGQTSLAFDFPIFNENHITVQLTRSNVVTTLVLNTNYTVPLASVGQESGGTVTLVSPALSGDVYTLLLDVPYERTTDFNQAGDFFADTLNLELDLLTQQNQQINRDISSTLRFQTADTAAGLEIPLAPIRAGKYLAFDGSGNVIAADGTGGTAISAPMVPFVQAASLVAAKALLITAESIATADIANNSVTFAKMQNISTGVVLGRTTALSGDVEELSTLPAVNGAAVTNISGGNISSGDIASARIVNALNATGTAPIYACRAWVNFNGTGTVAIRASGNVSSITDIGLGNYIVNFTNAMPDANYAAAGLAGAPDSGGAIRIPDNYTMENTRIRINCLAYNGVALVDTSNTLIAIFR